MAQTNEERQTGLPFPDLLNGSEYKDENKSAYRAWNLLGLAVTIVIEAEQTNADESQKQNWLKAFDMPQPLTTLVDLQVFKDFQLFIYFRIEFNHFYFHFLNIFIITINANN